jgi:curved DNA-binding protein CbpA
VTASPDPYKTLQVDPEAEGEVIAAAYRRLARKYHPDVAPGAEAAARMAAINAAWEAIGDPARRVAFDRERAVRAALERRDAEAAGTPSSRSGSMPGRTTSSRDARAPDARGPGTSGPGGPSTDRPPETVSSDWTSGRSTVGSRYDQSMHRADGTGAAGPPPGSPSGSVLGFGRYAGWSLGEIARGDLEYIEWLDRMPIGRPYRDEIDAILRRSGRRRSAPADQGERRGLFRRR